MGDVGRNGHRDYIEGVVHHLVYVSHDQYTILSLTVNTDEGEQQVTAAGKALFGVRPGECLRLGGAWTRHQKHGRQLRTEECQRARPATEKGIRTYLSSGFVRGIGPKLATAIVDQFGERTLDILDSSPQRMKEVPGIGEGRLGRLLEAWEKHRKIAEVMMFLQGLGISPSLAAKIYATYTDNDEDPLEVVREHPYRLSRDVHGVGFVNADRIALAAGVPKNSDERVQAAMLHVLGEACAKKGHCYVLVSGLLRSTAKLLDDDDPATAEILEEAVLREALAALCAAREVVTEVLSRPTGDGTIRDDEIAAPRRWYSAEVGLAQHVRRLINAPGRLAQVASWEERIAGRMATDVTELSTEQHEGVRTALTRTLSILTGGPGCGKTHTLRVLVELCEQAGGVVALAAPTGKAAKRLEEATGHAAMTVHRLIHEDSGDEVPHHTNALVGADLVVIDEASMLDVELACRMAAAIPTGCHLLLVGDTDQLPSIGPGRVLHDLLAVESIPRTRLTKVFRQHDDSAAIVLNAHRILAGEPPEPAPGVFGFKYMNEPEGIAQRVVDLVTKEIPRHFGVAPHDIQVLCPGRKQEAGVLALNRRLQKCLNPSAPHKHEHYHDDIIFREGDRVLQTKNRPQRGTNGVFNGSTGTVTTVNGEEQELTVTFSDGDVAVYPFVDLDELLHAYALTVHRSQGSEYPYVVIPMINAAGQLLQRNLLYTAVTRARRGVMLLGQENAIKRAVEIAWSVRRNTALSHRIIHNTSPLPRPRANSSGQLAWGDPV
ncbi:ATP-dependent RecD-like DNA helicase [Streptomyces sp. Ru73]|uniref:SF1B family DNA helicase RecD2 n=1 Tax=Streptomyces sp. Ru73 TaxID=2080748 RepID=UPI000CDD380B|nr:ATP-dependent RecD-like DNA helicase [Streptomyces sp. Ru73]POX43050.1 ATP-dependent RecD-like DNA helicase [Streptomyces sp. Ru73]